MLIGDGGHALVIRSFYNGAAPIIAIGDNIVRQRESANHKFFGIAIHPKAILAADIQIGEGTVIMAGAIVQPGVRIGKHCILNTGCTVDHHCVLEDFVHIAPGVHLCGNVHVGEGALVGVAACAVPGAKIPAWSLVRAGSVAK